MTPLSNMMLSMLAVEYLIPSLADALLSSMPIHSIIEPGINLPYMCVFLRAPRPDTGSPPEPSNMPPLSYSSYQSRTSGGSPQQRYSPYARINERPLIGQVSPYGAYAQPFLMAPSSPGGAPFDPFGYPVSAPGENFGISAKHHLNH